MIRFIEELSINALPSLETMIYDGWLIRFSKGFSKRSNSINPLYLSDINLEHKIARCEKLFKERNYPIIYKMTSSALHTNLDRLLEEKNYKQIDITNVLLLSMNKIPSTSSENIIVYESLEKKWILDFCKLSNIDYKNTDILREMLEAIIPSKYYISLNLGDETIACGLGVLEDHFIGLFNIIVDSKYRGKGYGEKIVLNLLNIGLANGATHSYLQVVAKNIPAVRLYAKLGFKEKYRYWYRVKL